MAADFTEDTATEAVTDSFAATPDAWLHTLLTTLTHHLHDFVRENELTVEEREAAIGFLAGTGHHCTDTRPEFILLSGHVLVAGSPYVESDAVFAVRRSLVRDFTLVDDPALARRYGVSTPFRHADFDLVLSRAAL
jgi:hypothetical protein